MKPILLNSPIPVLYAGSLYCQGCGLGISGENTETETETEQSSYVKPMPIIFDDNFTWTEEHFTWSDENTTLEEQDENTTYTETGNILR